jgi:hypothetical protein
MSINIGIVYPEFLLPPSMIAILVEMKYCEQCGRPFSRKFAPTEPEVRKERLESQWGWTRNVSSGTITRIRRRDHGEHYCSTCRFLPVPDIAAQEAYKAQLPGTPNQMKHSMRLPRYDQSLAVLNGRKAQRESAKKSARLLRAKLQ